MKKINQHLNLLRGFSLLSIFMFLLLSTRAAMCHPALATDVVRRDRVFVSYYHHQGFGNQEKAKKELKRISTTYRGTKYGACALFLLSSDKKIDPVLRRRYEKRLNQEYPDSRYVFTLKFLKIYDSPINRKSLNHLNKILAQVNGPDIFRVLEGKAHNFNPESIKSQYREDVCHVMECLASKLREIDSNKAFDVYLFLRNKFPCYSCDNIEMEMRSLVLQSKGLSIGEVAYTERIPPVIHLPENGDTNDRHTIHFLITDGDVSQSQVDLSNMVFTVNGTDVTRQMKVSSKIDRSGHIDPKNPNKIPFERIRISYRPNKELSQGVHRVYVRVLDGTGNQTEKRWVINVWK